MNSIDIHCLPHRQLFKLNVCRLCSQIRDKVLPIFDNAGSKVDVKIKECFPHLNIRKDDSKPQHICIDCITKLNMFNEFLQVCVESECKFDNYVKQYIEQETILKSTLVHDSISSNSSWQEDIAKTPDANSIQNDDGVIVLSKMDSVLRDPSVQDFVVMVELKYKDKSGADIPSSNADYNFNKVTSVSLNRANSKLNYVQTNLGKNVEPNLLEFNSTGKNKIDTMEVKSEERGAESIRNK